MSDSYKNQSKDCASAGAQDEERGRPLSSFAMDMQIGSHTLMGAASAVGVERDLSNETLIDAEEEARIREFLAKPESERIQPPNSNWPSHIRKFWNETQNCTLALRKAGIALRLSHGTIPEDEYRAQEQKQRTEAIRHFARHQELMKLLYAHDREGTARLEKEVADKQAQAIAERDARIANWQHNSDPHMGGAKTVGESYQHMLSQWPEEKNWMRLGTGSRWEVTEEWLKQGFEGVGISRPWGSKTDLTSEEVVRIHDYLKGHPFEETPAGLALHGELKQRAIETAEQENRDAQERFRRSQEIEPYGTDDGEQSLSIPTEQDFENASRWEEEHCEKNGDDDAAEPEGSWIPGLSSLLNYFRR
jgi:hypothetical protein